MKKKKRLMLFSNMLFANILFVSIPLMIGLMFPACEMDGGGDGEIPTAGPTVVTAFSLDGLITAPVVFAAANTTAIDEAQYTGSISWQTNADAAYTGMFAASTVYRAVVTLAAKSGWTFTGVVSDTFTYTGATVTNAADSGTVTITFPATAASGASAGISVSFTGPAGISDTTLDGGFWLSKSDTNYSSITISVGNSGNYDAFRWLVNGGNLAGAAGGSVTLNASNYAAGAYRLTVIAEKAGVPYSRGFSFAVVD
jgi:membrane carboxypeptidase/penicillin-binding protein PbpC